MEARLVLGHHRPRGSEVLGEHFEWRQRVLLEGVVQPLKNVPAKLRLVGLGLLGLSALAGLSQKWNALQATGMRASGDKVSAEMATVLETREKAVRDVEPNQLEVYDLFLRSFPWWAKGKAARNLAATIRDPVVFPGRFLMARILRQSLATALQIFLFVAFILWIALTMKGGLLAV